MGKRERQRDAKIRELEYFLVPKAELLKIKNLLAFSNLLPPALCILPFHRELGYQNIPLIPSGSEINPSSR
jgi:hypothetical protein